MALRKNSTKLHGANNNRSTQIWHPIAHHHRLDYNWPHWLSILGFKLVKLFENAYSELKERHEQRISRDAVKKMTELSDDELWDIGLTRQDLQKAINLPLSVNAAIKLEHIRQINRKKYHKPHMDG